jgi:thioredoxin-related protein
MKIKILLSFLVFIFFAIVSSAQTNAEIAANKPFPKFDPQRNAAKDIKAAVAEAKKTNRRVYIDVGGEWCIWCHRLDNFYETHNDLMNILKKDYVVVKVNYSPENKNTEVLSHYPKIEGYPHVFILDKNGKLLKSKDTGELEEGKGYNHDKVLAFLEEYAPKTEKSKS